MGFISDTYIHYGHRCFVPDLFVSVKNKEVPNNKPQGGLWASSINAPYGWKDWCEDNGYFVKNINESFQFRLGFDAEVFHIHSVEDVHKMPKVEQKIFPQLSYCPDFEKMLADGIDAIELHMSDDPDLYMELYGWDCDCILVMNPEMVEVV